MKHVSSIKRRLTLRQKGQRKKFFMKKKSWFTFGNRRSHFSYYDDEGFEIFDPILLDLVFGHWWDIYDSTGEYECASDLDETEYALDLDDDTPVIEMDVHVTAEVEVEAEEFVPLDDDVTDHLEEDDNTAATEYVEEEVVEEEVVEEVIEEPVAPEPVFVVPEPEPERFVPEPEPERERYVAPEPEPERYSGGDSYSSDSGGYDSGGSDSGGSDD